MRRKQTILCIAVLLIPVVSQADFLIQNARIIDGTGNPEFVGSVRVAGQRIAEIGDLQPLSDEIVFRVDGMVLAPGFIDTHSHHDSSQSIVALVETDSVPLVPMLQRIGHAMDQLEGKFNAEASDKQDAEAYRFLSEKYW